MRKAIIAAAAAGLVPLLVVAPAHANPADQACTNAARAALAAGTPPAQVNQQLLQCENAGSPDNGPICAERNIGTACSDCVTALGTSGQPAFRAGWACGQTGHQDYNDKLGFPCYVSTYRTDQHPCNGTMQSDGSIIRIDKTRTIATGPGTCLTGVCVPKEE